MKKSYIFILLIFAISACTKKSALNPLLGDWKMKELVNNGNVSDKTTFTDDSIITVIDTEGKSIEIKGIYKFDRKNKSLEITTRSYNVNYKIVSIDDDHMDLEDVQSKKIFKYIRY